MAGAFGALVVGAAATLGVPTAIGMGMILALTLVGFALHSAWRMGHGLATFAQAVPTEPDVTAKASGRARLAWPSLGLVVRGRAAVLREPELEAEAGGQPLRASVDEGEVLAQEALEALGIEAGQAPDPP